MSLHWTYQEKWSDSPTYELKTNNVTTVKELWFFSKVGKGMKWGGDQREQSTLLPIFLPWQKDFLKCVQVVKSNSGVEESKVGGSWGREIYVYKKPSSLCKSCKKIPPHHFQIHPLHDKEIHLPSRAGDRYHFGGLILQYTTGLHFLRMELTPTRTLTNLLTPSLPRHTHTLFSVSYNPNKRRPCSPIRGCSVCCPEENPDGRWRFRVNRSEPELIQVEARKSEG